MPDTTITALPAAAALTGTEVIPADQGAATVKVTVHDLGRYAWNNAPVTDLAVAGQEPTIAECDAALAALGLDKTANRFFLIRDTQGANAKLFEVLWRQSVGKYFAVPLKEVA
jgi:hypothetical protein